MKKSAFISDLLFTFLATGLFTLCLFRYLKMELYFAIPLALSCGTLATCSVGAFLQSKRRLYFLKKSDESKKEKLLRHLLFLSDEGKTKFFLERLSTENYPAKRFGSLRIYTQNALYSLRFSYSPVTEDDVLRFSRIRTRKQKILLCNKIENAALSLAKQLEMEVLTADGVYDFLKDDLSDALLAETPIRKPYSKRVKVWLSKSNAKRFLLAALLLLLSALLSPFPYYYIVFGGVLLLLALCIRIFGYE